MSLADDLLNDLTEEELVIRAADESLEPNIIIGEDRFITVPDELKKIAVMFDHRIETVTFDCPRYWDGADMSRMHIYVHYTREDGLIGMYAAKNIMVDEMDPSIMHFDWTLTRNVTGISGSIEFLVSITRTDKDGNEVQHWNSEINKEMYVSRGMDNAESIVNKYPDIISQLIDKMDDVEVIATPENMEKIAVKHLDEYLAANDENIKEQIKDDVNAYLDAHESDIPGQIDSYVSDYLANTKMLFSIGPTEPTHQCLWFDTSRYGGLEENINFNMVESTSGATMYAETDDGTQVSSFTSNNSGISSVTGSVTKSTDENYNYDLL